jgi:hypothetical protein
MHHDVKRLGCRTVPYPVTGFRLSLFRTNVCPPCPAPALLLACGTVRNCCRSTPSPCFPRQRCFFSPGCRASCCVQEVNTTRRYSTVYQHSLFVPRPLLVNVSPVRGTQVADAVLTAGTPIGLSNVVSHTFIDNGAQTTETCIIHPCGTPDQKPGLKQLEVQICTVLPSALFLKHPKVI